MTMSQRYVRAVQLTAPKLAAQFPGLCAGGYWLDAHTYFFHSEHYEPSLGRVVATPALVDARFQTVQEVISLQKLKRLISLRSALDTDLEMLAAAEFDMPDCNTLAVSVGKHHFLVDIRQDSITSVEAAFRAPALYSPNGKLACFVSGFDLGLVDRSSGVETPLTQGGARHLCYGQQSETALAAVSYRAHPQPAGLWSPDSRWFVTHQIDERALPELTLVQHAPPGGGRPVAHTYKYPVPGDPLPVATLVAIDCTSSRMVSFDQFTAPVAALSPFTYRRVWFGDESTVWFLRFDRHCEKVELIRLDLGSGAGAVVVSETVAAGYIDLHPSIAGTPNVRTLARSGEIIWYSERDGWGHLYLYDATTGKLKNQITKGSWLVRDILHVDEEQRTILFLAGGVEPESDPARRSLCSVKFDGTGLERLVAQQGDIFVPAAEPADFGQDRPYRPSGASSGISSDGHYGAVLYASVDKGDRIEIVDIRKRNGFVLSAAVPGPEVVPPLHFSATAADGVTQLHGVLFFPPDFDERLEYPLIDYIYPGPQISHQPQAFCLLNSAPSKTLAELGFVTMMLDTRGTPVGSRAFHQVGYPRLFEPQLADHGAVVRQLCGRYAFIDANRVGILGHSGGGAASVRGMCDYADIFKVGVAVCGNHDSSLYAAAWSDKYRGDSSVDDSIAVQKLKGRLLLICADMDENVHISQTFRLVDSLVKANRDFDLLVIPNEGHLLLMTSGYAQRRTWDYFVRNLLGKEPPSDFEVSFEPHEIRGFAKALWRELRQ